MSKNSGVELRSILELAVLAVSLLALPGTGLRAGDLIISEIMASNSNTIQDEDGEYSDWAEIYNRGGEVVNVDGYYLTDDPLRLTKFRLPAIELAPGEFLLVFLSEKNRAEPSGEIHANFKITSQGEYLALVEPDGETIAFHFSPEFPQQFPDVSYGISQTTTELALVQEGAVARAWVPEDGDLGTSWTAVSFDDGAWILGSTGVGFDTGTDYADLISTDLEGPMRARSSSAYLRVPFTLLQDPAALEYLSLHMKYDDGFVAYLNGTEVAQRNAPASPDWRSRATAEHGQPAISVMDQDFDGAGTSYVLTAHNASAPPRVLSGGPTGSYLELMRDNTGNLHNTIGFAAVPGPTGAIFARFDYRMPSSGRADGFAFALLETGVWGTSGPGPSDGFVWERPTIDGAFAVGFDIWPAGEENSVNVNWDGVEYSSEYVEEFELHNGVFNRVEVELVQDGPDSLVTVVVTQDVHGNARAPVTLFDNYRIRGLNIDSCRVAFGGRTGGAYTSVDLDNIVVEFTPGTKQLEYEEIDLTDSIDTLRSGLNVLAIHGLNRTSTDSDFLVLPELYAFDLGSVDVASKLYFTEPTPEWFNADGYPGVVATPQFSHPSGAHSSSFDLTLSTPTPGAEIRYTTDGAEPTESSMRYSSSIRISSSQLITAKAFAPGLLPSLITSNFYVRLSTDVRSFTSDLPIVIADTRGGGIGTGSFRGCQIQVIDVDPQTGRSSITDDLQVGGSAGIKLRGSSSLGFPKKMYGFEFWDEEGEDFHRRVLDMPRQSDWILYAPYSDKTLMRNYLSYQWSRDIGRYATRGRFVELFLNTGTGNLSYGSHYAGVYVLFEKIKRDDSRVDIEALTRGDNSEPEVTGGYIIKKDRLDPGDSGFRTNRGQTLAFVEPKEDEITTAQASYLRNYMNSFETALYGSNFRHPVSGYASYFDADASIDHHILVEMTKNIDGFRLSTFAYKPRGDKLYMGPIWDYNLSLGNADYLQGWIPQGWYYPQLSSDQYPWYPRLFEDADYQQRYTDRWAELRRGPFSTAKLLQDIDDAADQLAEAQVRNFQRWGTLGSYVWPNAPGVEQRRTWQSEVSWMKDWLEDRLEWLDSNYLTAPTLSEESQLILPGFDLTLSSPTGAIYYTLDGSDPRRSGGSTAPGAIRYDGAPVILDDFARVTARARSGSRWSAPTVATFAMDDARFLRITELQYHPMDPHLGSPYADDDFEFLEIQNIGATPVDLRGVRLTDGIRFDFTDSDVQTLVPGDFVVVCKNADAFAERYDTTGILLAGVYEGNLENFGETIRLENAIGEVIQEFIYRDTWYPVTDGSGHSLVVVDPGADVGTWSTPENWQPSDLVFGTPGEGEILSGGRQLPGDANQDSWLDVGDAVAMLLLLFRESELTPPCEGATVADGGNVDLLDFNGDALVDTSDVVHLLGYLYSRGDPHTLGEFCVRIEGCPTVCGR